MGKTFLCVGVLVSVVAGAEAQPLPEPPETPQPPRPLLVAQPINLNSMGPQVVEAQATKKAGEFTMTEKCTGYRQVVEEVVKVVHGRPVKYQRVVTVPYTYEKVKLVQVDGKKTKAVDMKGKAVDPATVSKMLKKKTAIVITYGSPMSETFRRVLKPNTLNIVLPPQVQQPPCPQPVPEPGPAVDDLPAPKVIDPDQR